MQEPSSSRRPASDSWRRALDPTGTLAPAVNRPRSSEIALDFYGIRVLLEGTSGDALERVAEDFRHFRRDPAPEAPRLTIELREGPPEYDRLPPLPASIYTPRNICYTERDRTYIDYFGRALAVFDRARGRVEVTSESVPLLHEIAFLTILSRVGEALDRRGLHRLHALAVARNGRAALFMMPSGCGKSTLGLGLMQSGSELELVSDDSPLIGRSGSVLPFPLRIGVLGSPPPAIPERFVRHMERMEFAPKYVISMAAFEGSIAQGELRPELVFLTERSLGRECTIEPAGFLRGYRACVRHMIVGVGLYQGLEFLLRTSALDLARRAPTLASRAWTAGALLARGRVFTLRLGRDRKHNLATILEFLGRELDRGASRPSPGGSA